MSEAIIFATIAMGIIGFNKRDFTVLTLKKLGSLLGIYITLSMLAFICGLNLYVGLIINLIIIFAVSYTFVSEYEEQVFYPLIMYYIYMQVNPITIKQLPLRLLLTSIGVIFMVLILCFMQRKKGNVNKSIISIVDNILEGTNLEKNFFNILKNIYRKRKANYYITTEDRKLISIIFSLERISKQINKENEDDIKNNLLKIKSHLDNKDEELNYIDENENYSKIYNYIVKIIHELEELDEKERKEYRDNWSKTDYFSIRDIFKKNFNIKSLKFTFAIKMSLGLSVLNFIVQYFGVIKLSWVMITVMVLIQPYFEDTLIKGINRLRGVGIGCLIFGIIFNIVQVQWIRMIIILIASLFYIKMKEYYKKQIFMTFITVGTATFTFDVNMLIPRRLLFVGVGIIVSYGIVSMLFPYTKKKGENELNSKIEESIELIKTEELKAANDEENLEHLRNLVLRAVMIGNKLGEEKQKEIINECCEISSKVLDKYI